MSPRRGGGSSSGYGDDSSSGSSCYACQQSLTLYSKNGWNDPYPPAYITFLVIALIAALVGLIGCTKARWQRNGRRDAFRSLLWPLALLALILFFLCQIVDTALQASVVSVTYLYYILYIFQALFWRVADIVIAFTVYRTIREYLCVQQSNHAPNAPSPASTTMSGLDGPFRIVSIVVISLLTLITIAGYGCNIAVYILVMTGASYYYYEDGLYGAYTKLTFVYYFIYIIWVVILLVFVGLKLKGKRRSTVPYVLLGMTILAMFVANLTSEITQGLLAFDTDPLSNHTTTYEATAVLAPICYTVIILALTFLGFDKIRNKGVVNLAHNNISGAYGGYGNTTNDGYANNMNGAAYPQQQQQLVMTQQNDPNKYGFQQAPPSEMSGVSNSTTPAHHNGYTPYAISNGPHQAPQPQFTPSPPPAQQQHQYPVPQQPQMHAASPAPQMMYTSPPPQHQGYAPPGQGYQQTQ